MATTRSARRQLISDLKEEGKLIGLTDDSLAEWVKEELRRVEDAKVEVVAKVCNPVPRLRDVAPMTVDEDLGAYVRHFESQAKRQGIDPKDWSLLLTDKMSGQLKTFLVETGLNLHQDFESVKVKLFTHAGFNEEKYRVRFHQLVPTHDDMRSFAVNTEAALRAWVRQSETKETFEDLVNLLIVDRIKSVVTCDLLERLNGAAKVSVEDNLKVIDNYKSTQIARVTRPVNQTPPYVAASSTAERIPWLNTTPRSPGRHTCPGVQPVHGVRKVSRSSKCFTCGRYGHYARDCHSNSNSGFTWRNRSEKRAVVEYGNNKRPYRCYKCNEQGHIAKECSMGIDTGACYSCRKPGQRNCLIGTSRASNWRTENVHRRSDDLKCYCCGGVGHISRVCPTAQRDMLGDFSRLKDSHMRAR
ncbi:uncharacterized protein LOC131935558 isoform X1 [Physella acuta]|uniref:uncharacterized protein LOC131935558 isoform X1 n=1 Tax=Physella acuta TaxID=109671 RepID=UPI0027DDFCCB|nr:uncharacterized protein LOC131935558 isoform X1 [Physella acuta]